MFPSNPDLSLIYFAFDIWKYPFDVCQNFMSTLSLFQEFYDVGSLKSLSFLNEWSDNFNLSLCDSTLTTMATTMAT